MRWFRITPMTFGGTHGGVEEAQKALNVNKKKNRSTQGIYGGGVCKLMKQEHRRK